MINYANSNALSDNGTGRGRTSVSCPFSLAFKKDNDIRKLDLDSKSAMVI